MRHAYGIVRDRSGGPPHLAARTGDDVVDLRRVAGVPGDRRPSERLDLELELGFVVGADVEMGDYDENPQVIFKSGQLPPPWNED